MSQSRPGKLREWSEKVPERYKPLGCCAGQALGCSVSFLSTWLVALLLSALLGPVFGSNMGENTLAGVFIAIANFVGSLVIAGAISFLAGRIFPVLKRKGDGSK